MDTLQARQRMVSDAILLERTARVLRRWRRTAVNINQDVYEANIRAAGHLEWLAGKLRDGAESGG